MTQSEIFSIYVFCKHDILNFEATSWNPDLMLELNQSYQKSGSWIHLFMLSSLMEAHVEFTYWKYVLSCVSYAYNQFDKVTLGVFLWFAAISSCIHLIFPVCILFMHWCILKLPVTHIYNHETVCLIYNSLMYVANSETTC